MTRLLLKLAMAATLVILLHSGTAAAQVSASTPKARRVRITRGPELERVEPDFVIVRWESNNPGGTPERFGVVRYGTDRKNLTQTATSPVRLNPEKSHTTFRVRVEGLKPQTTYYYRVDSMEPNGKTDGVKSTVKQFATR